MTTLRAERGWARALRYFGERNLEAATATCESLLAEDPDHALAQWMLSCIAAHHRQPRVAAQRALLAGAALRNEPAHAWLNTSWALITQGESAAAAGLLRRLPPPPPGHESLLEHAAVQFNLLELPQEALACVDSALRQGVHTLAVHHVRGQALQFLGRNDEAAAAYESALRLLPTHGPSHWSLAQLSLGNGGSLRIDRLRRLMAASDPRSETFAYLGYALFRELDRIGDLEAAWPALERAAAARRNQVVYDGDEEQAQLQAIASATAGFALEQHPPQTDAPVPIFIVGMPRTGTTLLERILGNHDEVAVCGELNDFRMQLQWTVDRSWSGYTDRSTGQAMAIADAALLGRRYLEKTAWRRGDAPFQTDKNQSNYHYCGLLLKALPQAKIVHLRRNPMDSCFSNFKEIFEPQSYAYSYSFAELARHFGNYRELMAHWHRLAPGRILDVDYEELVTVPDQVAARVTAFCGLAQRPALADIARNQAPVSTASSVQVRQPIHSANVDGWKRYSKRLAPLAALFSSEE